VRLLRRLLRMCAKSGHCLAVFLCHFGLLVFRSC
jgi:hypothetical protein